MSEPPDHRKEEKSQLKKALAIFGGLLLLILGALVVFFFIDGPPPKDAHLMPAATQVPELLIKLYESTQVESVETKVDPPFAPEHSNEQLLANITANENILALWEQLHEADIKDWRWIDAPAKASWIKLEEIAFHPVISKYDYFMRKGQHQQALQLSVKTIRFSRSLQLGQSADLGWASALSLHKIGLMGIEEAISDESVNVEQIKETQQSLVSLEFDPMEFSRCVQFSYLSFKDNLDAKRRSMHLKRNRTLAQDAQLRSRLIEANTGGEDSLLKCRELIQRHADALNNRLWLFGLHPNAAGHSSLRSSWGSLLISVERAMDTLAMHRVYLTTLAMRRFEIDHGQLPEKLDELVPEYIDSVPLDPYNAKPLRWNREKQFLYSVYRNGIDDGGHTDYFDEHLDLGALYFWSDAAREIRADNQRDAERK